MQSVGILINHHSQHVFSIHSPSYYEAQATHPWPRYSDNWDRETKIHHDKLQNALKEYTDKCTNLGRDGLRSYQAIIESGFIKDIDLLNVTVEEYPSEEEAQEVWDSALSIRYLKLTLNIGLLRLNI